MQSSYCLLFILISLDTISSVIGREQQVISNDLIRLPNISKHHLPSAATRRRLFKRNNPGSDVVINGADDPEKQNPFNGFVVFFYANWRGIAMAADISNIVVSSVVAILILTHHPTMALILFFIVGSILTAISLTAWRLGMDFFFQQLRRDYAKKYENEFKWHEAMVRELGLDKIFRKILQWPPKLIKKPAIEMGIEMTQIDRGPKAPISSHHGISMDIDHKSNGIDPGLSHNVPFPASVHTNGRVSDFERMSTPAIRVTL